jgi:O-succinylbenzoate synthase
VPAIELKVNALVTAEQEDWERVTQGFECVKLKVGGDHVAAAARVALLRETVGPDVAIRLDANRAWSDADALAFAGLVAPCGIEYIEEPLADPRGLASFAASAGIPVALDETLREVSRIGDDLWAAVGACVVKPTLHGAWALAGDLARKCREHDSKLVVSAAYESGVGMLGLARLISALGLEDVAHGLDTYRRLADDVLAVPLEVRQGRMTVPGLCEVRESVLEEVT